MNSKSKDNDSSKVNSNGSSKGNSNGNSSSKGNSNSNSNGKGNSNSNSKDEKYLPFINCRQCTKIPLREILRVEQNKRLITIVTEKGILERYGKIREVEEFLDERFYHCLMKTIINFDQVSSMKEQTIYFKNGDKIFLGRENFVRTKQTFAIYIKNPCKSNGSVV